MPKISKRPQGDADSIGSDLLYGANAISDFIFNSHSPKDRRRVYSLADSGAIPTFKLCAVLCGSRADIAAALAAAREAGRRRAQPDEAGVAA